MSAYKQTTHRGHKHTGAGSPSKRALKVRSKMLHKKKIRAREKIERIKAYKEIFGE